MANTSASTNTVPDGHRRSGGADNVVRRSVPVLSRYEFAAIIGERAREIEAGGPITVKDPGTSDARRIAYLEFLRGTCPKKLVREFPDGHKETWGLKETEFPEISYLIQKITGKIPESHEDFVKMQSEHSVELLKILYPF
jgi:DNA-directed RNA polymerase subunit K/omega